MRRDTTGYCGMTEQGQYLPVAKVSSYTECNQFQHCFQDEDSGEEVVRVS